MKRSSSIGRRALLKGMGATALTLPLLETMGVFGSGRAQAAPAIAPKRFLVFWTPNGTVPESWHVTGDGAQFQLSRILEPLAPHRDDLLILDGLDAMSAYKGPGDAHQKGTGQCLTGTELQEGNFLGAAGLSAGWANGISIDQAIADQIGKSTRFQSLELGVFVSGNNVNARINYRGPAQPLPPENDPRAAFERLFGDPSQNSSERAERIARRRSVLDRVAQRYDRVLSRLGSADRQKLEAHLTAVREIEQRLDSEAGSACAAPNKPDAGVDPGGIEHIPAVGRLQMDLLVAALSCDLTRVGTLMWMNSATDKTYPWLGIHDAHHDLAHRPDSDVDAQEKLTAIYRWYAEQYAYLLQKLKSVPEGDGTMLDNTFIVWVSEHSRGNIHDRNQLPYVAAGRAGGAVTPGRVLRFAGDVPHNNLWVSCLNMFGVETDTFGNPNYCTGPLSGLS